jgi:hypothetical protein
VVINTNIWIPQLIGRNILNSHFLHNLIKKKRKRNLLFPVVNDFELKITLTRMVISFLFRTNDLSFV